MRDYKHYVEVAQRFFQLYYRQGAYAKARKKAIFVTKLYPKIATAWADAAACSIYLHEYTEAIAYAQRALESYPHEIGAWDVLAHAYGELGQRALAHRSGRHALLERHRRFRGVVSARAVDLPPPPSRATREQNIIAFSLFGSGAKYAEGAILNARHAAILYPYWRVHVYLDESVALSIQERLIAAGAKVIRVQGAKIPGTLWRFLAYDTPHSHRVIFRDADSIVSVREAKAVQEWIESGASFHTLRDYWTHTELIMAGMWGVVVGALPSMQGLLRTFLPQYHEHPHFVDQYFLRQMVWPYAHHDVCAHDGVFGCGRPLEAVGVSEHIGYVECSAHFSLPTTAHEEATWVIAHHDTIICRYRTRVEEGRIYDTIPQRYARALAQGDFRLYVEDSDPK